MAKIFDQALQFGALQGIVGFDGVAADGFGDRMFAETQRVYLLTGGFEFIDQAQHEQTGIGDFDEGRE